MVTIFKESPVRAKTSTFSNYSDSKSVFEKLRFGDGFSNSVYRRSKPTFGSNSSVVVYVGPKNSKLNMYISY